MAENSSNSPILDINLNMLRGAFSFGLAWVAWQVTSPDFWMLGYVALVFAAAGTWRGLLGLWGLSRLLLGGGKLKRHEKKGNKAKADKLPNEEDLRKGGLVK